MEPCSGGQVCQPLGDSVSACQTEKGQATGDGSGSNESVGVKGSLSEPLDAENGADGVCASDPRRSEETADFELSVDDSKDLLFLNEELNNILDPKVGRCATVRLFNLCIYIQFRDAFIIK